MGDVRFIMIGAALIFSGFVILGIFGDEFQSANIESEEFGNCFVYSENNEPIAVDCADKVGEQTSFFGLIIALIVGGVVGLIKGIRGDWDNRVKPEDMVGPNRDNRMDGSDSDEGNNS